MSEPTSTNHDEVVAASPAAAPPDMLAQIQGVIQSNNRTELFLLIGTGALFALGIVSVLVALINGAYIWTLPAASVSAILYWPIKRIERLRNRNIALAASAALIPQLPPAQAAKEIQKLLERLFQDGDD